MTISEVRALIRDVKERTEEPRTPYTKGYLDALVYIVEWMEEDDE